MKMKISKIIAIFYGFIVITLLSSCKKADVNIPTISLTDREIIKPQITMLNTISSTPTNISTLISNKNTPILTPLSEFKFAEYADDCEYDLNAISQDGIWAVSQCSILSEETVAIWKIGEKKATPLIKKKDIAGAYYASFSPDGKQLILAIQGGALWLYNIDQLQTPKKLFSDLPNYAVPTWSPDSRYIAISYLVDGIALSIMNKEGKYQNMLNLSEISTNSGDAENMFGPSWSPDGNKIAYTITKDLLNPEPVQLWTIEISTGKKELLYSGKPSEISYNPVWSPDGKNILLANTRPLDSIMKTYLYNIKQKTFNILPFHLDPSYSRWSPDGKWIAVFDKDVTIFSTETNKSIKIPNPYDFLIWKDNNTIISEDYDKNLFIISIPNWG